MTPPPDELQDAAPTWQIRTLAHAYQERPPTEYIVDKFFATETVNIVYGAPGVMKSMILADVAAHVVAGTPWLPPMSISVKQAPVLWVDMDNGTRRTDERFDAIGRAAGLGQDAPLYYVSMPTPPMLATDLESVIILIDTILACRAEMVIIDNLGLITGDVEENSARMATVMGTLRIVAERTRAAVILIHHQRKGAAQPGGRVGDALRGHSSIEAAIDLALHVVREADSSELSIRSTKTRGVDVPPVLARFSFEHRPGTSDLARAWFNSAQVQRGDNPVRDSILYYLEGTEEITHTKLVQSVYDDLRGTEGRAKIRAWIDDMANVTGELVVEKGAYNARVIRRAK